MKLYLILLFTSSLFFTSNVNGQPPERGEREGRGGERRERSERQNPVDAGNQIAISGELGANTKSGGKSNLFTNSFSVNSHFGVSYNVSSGSVEPYGISVPNLPTSFNLSIGPTLAMQYDSNGTFSLGGRLGASIVAGAEVRVVIIPASRRGNIILAVDIVSANFSTEVDPSQINPADSAYQMLVDHGYGTQESMVDAIMRGLSGGGIGFSF